MQFQIKVYQTGSGKLPLYDFLQIVMDDDPDLLPNVVDGINRIGSNANWGPPLTKKISNDMFRVAVDGKYHFARIFYTTMPNRKLLVFNGYFKKENKLKVSEINKAKGMLLAFNKGGGNDYELFDFN